jgi:prophage antirepressor-like protein
LTEKKQNKLITFTNEQFGDIRVKVGEDGNPVFIAADACRVLGIKNSRDAVASLDDDEKDVVIADTPGGPQEMTALTPSGLYNLIFNSRKPEAKAFRRWVTHEVLEDIRIKGRYESPGLGGGPSLSKEDRRIVARNYEALAKSQRFGIVERDRYKAEAISVLTGRPVEEILRREPEPEPKPASKSKARPKEAPPVVPAWPIEEAAKWVLRDTGIDVPAELLKVWLRKYGVDPACGHRDEAAAYELLLKMSRAWGAQNGQGGGNSGDAAKGRRH